MIKKKFLVKFALTWVVFVFFLTFSAGLAYLVGQQTYRLSANDPQIQIAQDVARVLMIGQKPDTLIPPNKTEISVSLAPFLMIFDSAGKQAVSMVMLDKKDPVVPSGVFATARSRGEYPFTWQPKPGVRVAAVLKYYNGNNNSGFVLAGRSLREVEKRENLLLFQISLAWLGGLVASALLSFCLVYFGLKPRKRSS